MWLHGNPAALDEPDEPGERDEPDERDEMRRIGSGRRG
jgi:hypothetical protein